jgi:hypothetical protein
MHTDDDLRSLSGVTISDAEIRDQDGGQVLRLHLAGGGILAVSADGSGGLNVADQTSIP